MSSHSQSKIPTVDVINTTNIFLFENLNFLDLLYNFNQLYSIDLNIMNFARSNSILKEIRHNRQGPINVFFRFIIIINKQS